MTPPKQSFLDIREHIEAFVGLKALIIGDVMVDTYLWGDTDRISPESPVPVVSIKNEENRLGGAANVALNMKAMGAIPILCSTIGNDIHGETFVKMMKSHGLITDGILTDSERTTTKKTRVISRGQQLIRVDRETTAPLNKSDQSSLTNHILSLIDEHAIKVVVFQDYDKGLLSEPIIKEVISKCLDAQIPVTVDPKKDHFF